MTSVSMMIVRNGKIVTVPYIVMGTVTINTEDLYTDEDQLPGNQALKVDDQIRIL